MSDKEVEYASRQDPAGDDPALTPPPIAPSRSGKPPAWMWLAIGGLAIVALAVVFVLPAVVSEYELPLERRVDTTPAAPASSAPSGPAVSPFEEAQRARQRKEAQDVLAEVLEIQTELEAQEVSTWAGEAYDAALEQGSIGDEYYRTQDFISATASYSNARDALQGLLDSRPDVLTRTLAQARQALAAGDSAGAEDQFSLALLLAPDNEAAQAGLDRARTLDEVLALFDEAESLREDGELEQARETYREIVNLDGQYQPARERIDQVSAEILAAQFNRVMSSGYTLLEQGDPEAAIAAFERAANLGVNEEQARAAIAQTETEVANARINAARERIAAAEADEQWQDAVAAYDDVLAIDPNLIFAIEGRDYARKRANLNQLLTYAINNPERFSDDDVFQETVDVYFTGRAIENPGPRLQGQLDELQVLLETSQVPLDVTLVSDNRTEVTVLRVADLGLFEQTTLTLKPGNYVAVGSRLGYREVRKEFTVGFGKTPEQVVVQCEERVVAASR
jgi:tetratricopeptide (TPR) repeat protein